MTDPGPSVRSQRLMVEAGSERVALALQPRISDLNRRRLVPVIERVLREMDVPGRQVRIERLVVDLGEVPLTALDTELPRLLERDLRRAVAAALRGEDREARVRARPVAQARAELLEHHLLRGTLPFWAPPGTSLASLVDDMAESDPGRLADVVRRLGTRPRVLDRLVAQLSDRGMARLVRVLEPEHAALVLAYVFDVRRVHRRQPLLPLSDRRFARHLWTLVQTYLVQDPGTEFNRRSFVRSLLQGMSRGQGLDYRALLATLARGLERTRRRRAARSSLPAVVGELLREEQMDLASADPAFSREKRRRHSGIDTDDALDSVDRHPSADPAASAGDQDLRSGMDADDAVDAAEHVASSDLPPSAADRDRWIGPDAPDTADAIDPDPAADDRGQRPGIDADGAVDAASRDAAADPHYSARHPSARDKGRHSGVDEEDPADAADHDPSTDVRSSARDEGRRSGADADEELDAADRDTSTDARSSAGDEEMWIGIDAADELDAAVRDPSTGVRSAASAEGRRSGADAADELDAAGRASSTDVRSSAGDAGGRVGMDAEDELDAADRDSSTDARTADDGRQITVGSDDTADSADRDASADPRLSASGRRRQRGSETVDEVDRADLDGSGRDRAWQRGSGEEEGVSADDGSDGVSSSPASRARGRTAPSSDDRAKTAGREDRDGAARAEEQRAFGRYDAAEAAGYLLRHGVLPWGALLRDPGIAADRVLSALQDLPQSLLREALRADGPEERRRMLDVLARGLAEDDLARLLVRVLPAAAASGPFRDSVRAFTDAAADRSAFLARVIGAAIDGDVLDLEALVAEAGGMDPPRPAQFATWPAHLLKSTLTDALRAGPAAAHADPTPAALLTALADAYPADARHYLRALAGNAQLAAALARTAAPPLHERVLEVLDPAAARTARALQTALAALPPPHHRPSDGEQREVVLREMLRLREGQAPNVVFFARVLERLFGSRLPEAVGEQLLAAAEEWARPGALPAAHAAAFRAAVTAALAPAERTPSGEEPPSAATDPRGGQDARRARQQAVFAFLLGRPALTPDADGPLSADALRHLLEKMMREAPEELTAFLRRHATDRRLRERWARVLPEATLARLARVLAPRDHAPLLAAAEMLHEAWRATAPSAHVAGGRPALWSFVMDFLARNAGTGRSMDRLVAAFFTSRAARVRGVLPAPELAPLGERLLQAARDAAVARGHARLHAALHRQRGRLLALWSPSAPREEALPAPPPRPAPSRRERGGREPTRPGRPSQRHPAFGPGDDGEEHDGEPVYVANAGLVLAAPFLPRLFERLNLLHEEEGAEPRHGLRDAEAVSRGVHALQYLVDGSTSTPEPALALNKVLCGVPLAVPVDASIQLTDEERATCDQLLTAIITNWGAIPGTSVAGLRETFLQREGKLVEKEGAWRLTVQRKTLDVLVDQVPWGISVVFHPWMPTRLHVSW